MYRIMNRQKSRTPPLICHLPPSAAHRHHISSRPVIASRTLSSDAHDEHHDDHPTFEPGPFSHANIGILTILVCFISSGTVIWTTQHQLRKHGFKD